jgi:hypothetical protein
MYGGLISFKLRKPQRKPLLAAIQTLLNTRTKFFPAYKRMCISLSLSLSRSPALYAPASWSVTRAHLVRNPLLYSTTKLDCK